MKQILLSLFLLSALSAAKAQKLEITVNAGTGLYNYTGSGADAATAFIGSSSNPGGAYVNNIYGRRAAFSYQGGLQAKLVTRGGFLFGAGAGYQFLRSKTDINAIYSTDIYYGNSYYGINSTSVTSGYTQNTASAKYGSAVLTNQYINLAPYVGYRFKLGRYSLDAMPGLGFGIGINSREKGKATSDYAHSTYTADYKPDKALSDLRADFNLSLNLNGWGINAGYAKGLLDYNRGKLYEVYPTTYSSYTAGNYNKVYSRFFSAGVFYRLK